MREKDNLTKKVLAAVVTANRGVFKEMKLTSSSERAVLYDDMLSTLQGRSEEQLLASAVARSSQIICAGNAIVNGNSCSQHTDVGADEEEIVFTPL